LPCRFLKLLALTRVVEGAFHWENALLKVGTALAGCADDAAGSGAAAADLQIIINDGAEAAAVGVPVGAVGVGDLEWGHRY
jgi:hypothetical protein